MNDPGESRIMEGVYINYYNKVIIYILFFSIFYAIREIRAPQGKGT